MCVLGNLIEFWAVITSYEKVLLRIIKMKVFETSLYRYNIHIACLFVSILLFKMNVYFTFVCGSTYGFLKPFM